MCFLALLRRCRGRTYSLGGKNNWKSSLLGKWKMFTACQTFFLQFPHLSHRKRSFIYDPVCMASKILLTRRIVSDWQYAYPFLFKVQPSWP